MTETAKEVQKILGEIEAKDGDSRGSSKTTKEIVKLLLNRSSGEEQELTHLENFVESGYKMDLEELKKWKENNNQIFEVNYGHFIFNNRRFIGKIIVFFRKIARRLLRYLIEPIIAEQNQFNASVTASINAVYNNDLVVQNYIFMQEQKTKELEGYCKSLEQRLDLFSEENKIKDLKEYCKSLEQRLNLLGEEAKIKAEELNNFIGETANRLGDDYAAIDYFKFEDNFRGSRESIKQGQKKYVDYFRNTALVLDLGCGRGEFLELLKEDGIDAKGVDLYEEFADYCVSKNLDVICDDAISYLAEYKDKSIGGIFAAQLVEHLKFNQMAKLCQLAYEKLMRGSYLILETPNPTSLNTFTNAFYVDPSHNKPVHPQTLKYILEDIGFTEVEILYTEESKSNYKLPLLDAEEVHNLATFNDGINCLTENMFGSQDYAVIARK